MTQTVQSKNPLQQYFRAFKMYMGLPSGKSYYPPGTVDFTDSGEVGIMSMTGKDELILKNPDALLNGESLIEVIQSCVPSVKNARLLLTNDIDALITAIRYATFNDSLETTMHCPKCKTENTFKLDLQYALDSMSYLDPEYVVNLDGGLSIFVKPYSFPDMLAALHSEFERKKLAMTLDGPNTTEQQRSDFFTKTFKSLAMTKFSLLLNSIVKIVDESNNVNVTDKAFISEFLDNTDRATIDKIDKLVADINKVGIKRTFTAECSSCKHKWESDIDFNPVNFS